MSKYATLEAQFRDRGCLIAALAEMGYTKVEIHEQAEHLVGYHGDLRPEVANVIVRRQYIGGASNDIGFVRNADGRYAPIISEYDQCKHDSQWMTDLKKHYTEHVIVKEAKRQGLRLYSRGYVNGKLVVKYLKQGL